MHQLEKKGLIRREEGGRKSGHLLLKRYLEYNLPHRYRESQKHVAELQTYIWHMCMLINYVHTYSTQNIMYKHKCIIKPNCIHIIT